MHMLVSLDELREILEGASWVSFDVETTGTHHKKDELLGFGVTTNRGFGYAPLYPYRTEASAALNDPLDREKVRDILLPVIREVPIIGWNVIFDNHFLYKLVGEYPDKVIDPEVGLWLLNEVGAKALKEVSSHLLEEELPDFRSLLKRATAHIHDEIRLARKLYQETQKAQGVLKKDSALLVNDLFPMQDARPQDIPIEWLSEYCVKDTLLTAILWFDVIEPGLEEEGLLDYFHDYEMQFQKVLWKMEENGVLIDLQFLHQLDKKFESDLRSVESAIVAEVGHPININSHDQLHRLFFEEMHLQPLPRQKKTETGRPSLDSDSLQMMRDAYGKETSLFNLLLKYKEIAKLRSSYTQGLPKVAVDGRVYTDFKQTGTATGRLASQDPNLQNIPKDSGLRNAFLPTPGYLIVKADYSQAELRVLADRTQDPLLLNVYQEGRDLHNETQHRNNLSSRTLAKRLNFGAVYGIGPGAYRNNLFFEDGIERSWKDCKADIDGFYETYAHINPWKARVFQEGETRGYVVTRFGRRRRAYFEEDMSPDRRAYQERQFANVLIQGDVADIVKAAMILIDEMCIVYGARPLLQVHDELVYEVPENYAYEFARQLKRLMANVLPGFDVPLGVEVGVGRSWGEAKEVEEDVPAVVASQ